MFPLLLIQTLPALYLWDVPFDKKQKSMRTSLFPLLLLTFHLALGQTVLPENMYPDTLHAPFLYGVASGDPLPNQVIIWTHITSDNDSENVNWEVAIEPNFNLVEASGSFTTDASRDFTVKIDVANLIPGATYYYRFQDSEGNYSPVGRTKTAPMGEVAELKFAVASCSSVYSGFFNAYQRIAERDDLDLVIHLGDYIYDFVDEDEEVRVPDPYPTVPQNVDEWRDRHQYYLLDPNLRAARQNHPWAQIWDNHDVKRNDFEAGVQAFYDWVPIRQVNDNAPEKIYRKFQYGNLLDLMFMDILLFRDVDSLENEAFSVLGLEQFDWLQNNLESSTATWKIIGNQKMFGLWSALTVPDGTFPTDGDVFDDNAWDGYMLERDRVLEILENNSIDNVMILSGDAHISMAMDLPRDPLNPESYLPESCQGSLAVEFLPTSISRGNLDEQGVDPAFIELALAISLGGNPHHQYSEFVQHGYGLLTIQPDSILAQYMYSEILEITDEEVVGLDLVVENGANHWKRACLPVNTQETNFPESYIVEGPFPNPSEGLVNLTITSPVQEEIALSLLNAQGQTVLPSQKSTLTANTAQHFTFQIKDLPKGIYWIKVQNNQYVDLKTVVKQR